MEPKLSYIRCAVLLHAAKARFNILGHTEKIAEVNLICRKLSKSILRACHSKSDDDLTLISEKIYAGVRKIREGVRKMLEQQLKRTELAKCITLEKLEMLVQNEHLSLQDVESKFSHEKADERKIIKKVKAVNGEVAKMYKVIMQEISAECLRLLPSPPCDFSIIGLGSLAREEVTMYSDFEHVILLENAIEYMDGYEKTLEYFGWFSVLFQIIIIGFGETTIPSVAIESLNDVYSGDPNQNWFHDSFTPKGMSFDGMLPHSCNNAMGQQQKTKNRSHAVKLMKTPPIMAEYLTHDGYLRYGYYQTDVLRQTCLVYGDEDLYDSFIETRDHSLDLKDKRMQEHDLKTLTKISNGFVRHRNSSESIAYDSKHVFYGPLSMYVRGFAKLHGVEEKPTFTLIEKLHEKRLLNSSLSHQLSYAFAVACEIRMKSHHMTNQQKQAAEIKELKAMVGEDALYACHWVMGYCSFALGFHVASTNNSDTTALCAFNERFGGPFAVNLLLGLLDRGKDMEAIKYYQKLKLHPNPGVTFDDSSVTVYFYFWAAQKHEDLRPTFLAGAEALCNRLGSSQCQTDYEKMILVGSMAQMYAQAKDKEKRQKAVDRFEEYFEIQRRLSESGYSFSDFTQMCFTYCEVIKTLGFSIDDANRKLRTTLWDKFGYKLVCQLMKRLNSATEDAKHNYTRSELRSISNRIRNCMKKLDSPSFLLAVILRFQVGSWWLEDAADAIELFQQAPTHFSIVDAGVYGDINMNALKFLCQCLSGKYSSEQNKDKNLLEKFAFLLWRGITRLSHGAKESSIVVMIWLIHLRIFKHYRSDDIMFSLQWTWSDSSARLLKSAMAVKAVNEFAEGYKQSDKTAAAARLGTPYARLLLEKSMRDFCQHSHQSIIVIDKKTECPQQLYQQWCKWPTMRSIELKQNSSQSIATMNANIVETRRRLADLSTDCESQSIFNEMVSKAWRGIQSPSGANDMVKINLLDAIYLKVQHSKKVG